MTIAALRRLLDEIDRRGGPEAARQGRLHIPDIEGATVTMTTTHPAVLPPLGTIRPPAVDESPEKLPVGPLLKWGDEHDDPEVQAQAARARAALVGLRQRYAADRELNALESEEERLARRLEEIRARKGELALTKPKKTRKPVGYPAADVRAWARANNIDCPPVGRIPKAIVEAWRECLPQAG